MPLVRKARQEDLEQLVGLLRLLFAIEEDFSFDAARQQQGLALLLNDDRGCVLAAETGGRVVEIGRAHV